VRLYLDDIRTPPPGEWVICRDVEQAQAICAAHGCPAFISFDHDLGEDVATGYDFAHWLVDNDLDTGGAFIPEGFTYNVHSANPVGAANITGLLDGYLEFRR